MVPEASLPYSQVPATCPYSRDCFISRGSISPCECYLTWVFDNEALLAPRPTPKLEDRRLSAVRDCLFNIFAATLHIGGRSCIRNLRTRHVVVTGTPLITGMGEIATEITNLKNIIFNVFYEPPPFILLDNLQFLELKNHHFALKIFSPLMLSRPQATTPLTPQTPQLRPCVFPCGDVPYFCFSPLYRRAFW